MGLMMRSCLYKKHQDWLNRINDYSPAPLPFFFLVLLRPRVTWGTFAATASLRSPLVQNICRWLELGVNGSGDVGDGGSTRCVVMPKRSLRTRNN
ncbi:hypothetical protein VNO78_11471 [Psophocarpus tetragonolobus]|uniref:Uncharacterized protein n=1 Tax=Psophocarpus tetragonolobus TaxID=3891 RepID=A0AAN9XNZ6_PSOTE